MRGVFASTVFILAASVFSVGCQRENVLIRVGDSVLTESEMKARAENIVLLVAHVRGRDAKKADLDQLRRAFLSGYDKVWVEDRVLEREAARAGVQVSEDHLATCRKGAFSHFASRKDRCYEDLLKIEGLHRAYWDDQVRSEALRLTMRDFWAAQDPTNLPPTYAADVIAAIRVRNAHLAMTNVLQYAKATNVWQQLKSGADFIPTARLNTELTDEIQDDCEWGVLDEKFLADEPELRAWLKDAQPGEFSPPLSADNGILIVRYDRPEEEGCYAVSRIFFRLAQILKPASPEEIVAVARNKHAQNLFQTRLAELVGNACVENVNLKTKTKGQGK